MKVVTRTMMVRTLMLLNAKTVDDNHAKMCSYAKKLACMNHRQIAQEYKSKIK